MPSKPLGFFAHAWYQWKALRFPWRKRFFVGHDLHGNTFWEFRLTHRGPPTDANGVRIPSPEPWRRIVHYPRSVPYSEVKVSPLWHQWLRYTRDDPPSLVEQRDDVIRQERIKLLAAQADARWEAKPRLSDVPGGVAASRELPAETEQPGPALQSQSSTRAAPGVLRGQSSDKSKGISDAQDPWAQARPQGASENWQPASWSPSTSRGKG
ncbi:hypothetical protein HIM_01697 [Hirsutella minnesotensis 3608]|nr:hypothetical protein HIM_01697 [Hirsutella minnesotensis 3608]